MLSARDNTCTLTTLRIDAAELPTLRLVVLADGPEVAVTLGLDPIVVGSGTECDLTLDDRRVSRRHCSFAITERGIVLRDEGSKNGTFVGTLAVREAVLQPEMIVSVGAVRLAVRVTGAPGVVPLLPLPRFGRAIGGSVVMRALFAKLLAAAATEEKILLRGESGTGKEVLARAIHEASPRKDGPFVVLDCGAIAPQLIESELFGNVRGAFTGATHDRVGVLEQANGGTLFLDEIGELPIDLQPRLLRALETREVRPLGANAARTFDARIVSATHRDLRAGMTDGTFRSDLYYRLAVIEARVPPLRERGDDLELLSERILAEHTPPRTIHDLPPNTLAMLRSHAFPGNVRELRNVLARLVLFPELGAQAIDGGSGSIRGGGDAFAPLYAMPLREAREQLVERFESKYVATKLYEQGGNVARAAAATGVSRQFFYRLLERYGLKSND